MDTSRSTSTPSECGSLSGGRATDSRLGCCGSPLLSGKSSKTCVTCPSLAELGTRGGRGVGRASFEKELHHGSAPLPGCVPQRCGASVGPSAATMMWKGEMPLGGGASSRSGPASATRLLHPLGSQKSPKVGSSVAGPEALPLLNPPYVALTSSHSQQRCKPSESSG